MENLLTKKMYNKTFKRFLTAIMTAALLLTGFVFGNSTIKAQADERLVTLYFVDHSAQQWVQDDDAVMILVDNTNDKATYVMGQVDDITWKAEVPASANNITFERYKPDMTQLWNTWSAGGRDGKNAYFADEWETGSWGVIQDEEPATYVNYRIELTWGATPSDLDTYLSYYENGRRLMYVNYMNKTGYINGQKVAELDVDDTTGYGPETITMEVDAKLLEDGGMFRYSIQNYTDRFSTDTNALSMSDAVVRVYKGGDLITTYFVPKDKEGTVWHVFNITKDGIVPVNEFEYISGVTNVN